MTKPINMMQINLIQFAPVGLNQTEFKSQQTIIAQQVNDPDVMGQMGEYLTNFYESGQLWALLIGIVLGYVIRGILGR